MSRQALTAVLCATPTMRNEDTCQLSPVPCAPLQTLHTRARALSRSLTAFQMCTGTLEPELGCRRARTARAVDARAVFLPQVHGGVSGAAGDDIHLHWSLLCADSRRPDSVPGRRPALPTMANQCRALDSVTQCPVLYIRPLITFVHPVPDRDRLHPPVPSLGL